MSGDSNRVVTERYGPVESIDEGSLREAESTIGLPPDWRVVDGYRVPLEATIALSDSRGTAAAHMPTTLLRATRGNEQLEVEIADTSEPASREYAAAIMSEGTPEPFPLGRGYAGGPAAVIDTGNDLIRATYDDGLDGREMSPSEGRERLRRVHEVARELMRQMGNR